MIRARIEQALKYRLSLESRPTPSASFMEGDLLPSLIVDVYGDYIVLQALSQTTDRLLPFITQTLVDLLQPAGSSPGTSEGARTGGARAEGRSGARHDSGVGGRARGSIEYDVNLRDGQKTGLFLDQRENRVAAAR